MSDSPLAPLDNERNSLLRSQHGANDASRSDGAVGVPLEVIPATATTSTTISSGQWQPPPQDNSNINSTSMDAEATPKLSNASTSTSALTSTTPTRNVKNPFRQSLASVGRRIKGRFNKTKGGDENRNYGSLSSLQQHQQQHQHQNLGQMTRTTSDPTQTPTMSWQNGTLHPPLNSAQSMTMTNKSAQHSNHSLSDPPDHRHTRIAPHGDNHNSTASPHSESTVIRKFETALRWLVLLGGAFFLGTCLPSNRSVARETLQYLGVAWGTAICLLVAVHCDALCQSKHPQDDQEVILQQQEQRNDDAQFAAMEEGYPLLGMNHTNNNNPRGGGAMYNDYASTEPRCLDFHNDPNSSLQDGAAMVDTTGHRRQVSAASSSFTNSVVNMAPLVLPHPALKPLHVTDAKANRRANLNSPKHTYVMDTEYFVGHMMILIRTPDVDQENGNTPYPENADAVAYLRGKQRRFEFQFQGRLKKIPTGRLYFACELEQSIKLGMLQRAFVSAAMAFVKSTNPFFHYSIAGDPTTGEPPHMAFPFFAGMNRVVATPPGQPPPPLGVAIEESAESMKNRAKGRPPFEWNTQDTYTFALWSAYTDFLSWKVLNLPGIRPFALQSVLGLQPIHVTVYEMDEEEDSHQHGNNGKAQPHIRSEDRTLVRIELCNEEVTPELGPAARQAMAIKDETPLDDQPSLVLTTSAAAQTTIEPAITAEEEQEEVDEEDSDANHEGSTAHPSDGEGAAALNMSAIIEYDEEESTAEEEAAAGELGEGIYIRSGDSIVLKEIPSEAAAAKSEPAGFMSIGGGFCVVQEQPQQLCTLVIEKIRSRSRQSMSTSQHGTSSLIKSGDTVRFKLIKGDGTVLYLTIHRGWWLKWVNTESMKNGHFTIHTLDSESSYLTVGGSFWLQHKKWAKFAVGVGSQDSPTYGGRMMGLYRKTGVAAPNTNPSSSLTEPNASDTTLTNPGLDDEDLGPDNSKAPEEWMKPVSFRVFEGGATLSTVGSELTLRSSAATAEVNEKPESATSRSAAAKLRFSQEDASADVPIWIESLNRTERVRHLSFIVRVIPPKSKGGPFVRIRTGRDLAEVMRVGLHWRNSSKFSHMRPNHSRHASRSRFLSFGGVDKDLLVASPNREENNGSSSTGSPRNDDILYGEERDSEEKVYDEDDDWDGEEDEEYEDGEEDGDEMEDVDTPTSPSRKRDRPRRRIRKFARQVTNRTLKAGKGTVAAGKSVIPIRPKNPPMKKEPNQKVTTRSRRRTEQELHVAVSRGVKKLDRNEASSTIMESSTSNFVAGELSAPERSCRSVSNMLTKMSSVPRSSEHCSSFSELLNSKVSQVMDHDKAFLQGKAIDLGVVPKDGAVCGAVVAVCKWEGHWREEWCGLYERTITFYPPLTNAACFELSLADIQSFRLLDIESERINPLPGLPILVLETAWQCHYLAFADQGVRQHFYGKLEDAKNEFDRGALERQAEMDLWKARFWQGFRSSYEASLFGGKGKWAEIASGRSKKRRVVLNKRRMAFDLNDFPRPVCAFSEGLLSKSLSFRLESLLEHPEALVGFLDATSQLQNLPLRAMDLMDVETFCTFVNLYHCLLQHALLLTVNGPLTIRSCGHFMRTSCYEIGGDVFSLAELYLCVIRGHMARPMSPRPPFFDAPKKSLLAYQNYALNFMSNLTNFALNTGSISWPRQIPILTPAHVDSQLSQAVEAYCQKNVVLDEGKRTVYVPRVGEVFRGDFVSLETSGGGSAHQAACLKFCLTFLDPTLASKIQALMNQGSLTIKFQQHMPEQYHSTLQGYPAPKPISPNLVEEDKKLDDL